MHRDIKCQWLIPQRDARSMNVKPIKQQPCWRRAGAFGKCTVIVIAYWSSFRGVRKHPWCWTFCYCYSNELFFFFGWVLNENFESVCAKPEKRNEMSWKNQILYSAKSKREESLTSKLTRVETTKTGNAPTGPRHSWMLTSRRSEEPDIQRRSCLKVWM